MRLFLLLAVALLSTAFAPAPLPRAKPVLLLDGTSWIGDWGGRKTTCVFEKGGVLTYSHSGRTYRNGTWSQKGDVLYWETNGRYAEFKGTVKGDEIAGKAWNVKNKTWEVKMKRKAERKP